MIFPEMSYKELKTKLHVQILEDIDLETLNRLSEGVARERVGLAIRDMGFHPLATLGPVGMG